MIEGQVKGLSIAVGILAIIVLMLMLYILVIRTQLRRINRQLENRLAGDTRQPIRIELINHELNQLTSNINKCLKAEETLRLECVREEKRFKELIANISHDLRTPLTAIRGYQQLMEKGQLTEGQRKKLGIAQKHAEQLGQLVDHFFEYSYLLNSELKPQLVRINLTNLLTECLAGYVSTFEEHGLTLSFEETSPIFVLADKEMTLRIIQNLLRNCITHSAGNVEVKLSALQTAVISIKNPIENTSQIDTTRLFDRFYTGDKSRSKTTGLGLPIVKILAEEMGGNVVADLYKNQLTIQVEFPLTEN